MSLSAIFSNLLKLFLVGIYLLATLSALAATLLVLLYRRGKRLLTQGYLVENWPMFPKEEEKQKETKTPL